MPADRVELQYTPSVPLFLSLLLSACGTDPEPVSCVQGELLDGDACVPEICGTGTWGELETGSDTIYVDGSAESGGDGSKDRPFTVIQEGLDVQGTDGMVAVAAGTYVENLYMDSAHSGVLLPVPLTEGCLVHPRLYVPWNPTETSVG